jgi:recombination protein RecA
MTDTNDRKKSQQALESAIAQLEKRYGKGAVMELGDGPIEKIEAIPTGSLGLDIALGIGGIPRGRICEIYGPESSGKTTLALHIASETQKKGGKVLFIDAEHALDVKYAKKLGVDISTLLVSQPDCGEQAFEIAETMIQSNSVDLIVIDSVAALTPRAEIDGEMEDQQPGMQARLMSKALRKLTAITARANCTIIFINQIRMKIGVMFGSPETTAGGNALKFYCSVRMDIRRIGAIKDNNDVTGNRVRVKVVKNKVAAPFRETEFDVIFNEGISQVGEILDIGSEQGIVDKAGAWYSFRGERIGQGREGAKMFLKENPDLLAEIRSLILSTMGIEGSATEEPAKPKKIEGVTTAAKLKSSPKKGAEPIAADSDGADSTLVQ